MECVCRNIGDILQMPYNMSNIYAMGGKLRRSILLPILARVRNAIYQILAYSSEKEYYVCLSGWCTIR